MNINNIDDIRKLASGDEGGRTEYKLTTGQLERGMETLCAFLNGEGGTVLFGVKDNGKIIGQEVSDKTKREIAEAIRLIEPFATITVSYAGVPDTDKQVIALSAEEQRYMRPFTYKGRAYQRIESVTSVMPQDKYNHLLMQRGGKYSWEAMPNPDLQVSDLDENVIIGAVRAGINCGRLPETTIREEIPAILEKFDLLHDGKLNNAAAGCSGATCMTILNACCVWQGSEVRPKRNLLTTNACKGTSTRCWMLPCRSSSSTCPCRGKLKGCIVKKS